MTTPTTSSKILKLPTAHLFTASCTGVSRIIGIQNIGFGGWENIRSLRALRNKQARSFKSRNHRSLANYFPADDGTRWDSLTPAKTLHRRVEMIPKSPF